MAETPTGYWLGGVPLWQTRLYWPAFYTGARAIVVPFFQPGSMAEELQPLVARSQQSGTTASGVDLVIQSARVDGTERLTTYPDVVVVSVEWINDGPTGCRVEIADRRWLLQKTIMDENWNLKYQGQYLPGTSHEPFAPATLEQAWRKLAGQVPFRRSINMDAVKVMSVDGESIPIPEDRLTAGMRMDFGVDHLFEHWGLGLYVNSRAEFDIADKARMDTIPELEAAAETLELVGWQREMLARRASAVPKAIEIPFWEDHNLLVPKVPLSEDRDDVLPAPNFEENELDYLRGTRTDHGLTLRPVYKFLDGYYEWLSLLTVWGYDAAAIGHAPLRFYMHQDWHAQDPGSLADALNINRADNDLEYERRVSLKAAVDESERRFYAIVHAKGQYGVGAWTNMNLGRRDGWGTLRPFGVIGDWTELYDEVKRAPSFRDSLIQYNEVGVQLAIIHRSTAQFTTGRAPPSISTDTPSWYRERRRLAPLPAVQGRIWPRHDVSMETIPIPDPALDPSVRNFGEAAPFAPQWAAGGGDAGVIELQYIPYKANPGSEAVIGFPVRNLRAWLRVGGGLGLPAVYDGIWREFFGSLTTKVKLDRQNLEWDPEYQFWICVSARRNYPNDKRKWWIETVTLEEAGVKPHVTPDSFGDNMMLEADDRLAAIRDLVNYARAPLTGTASPQSVEALLESLGRETNRPNGNDRFGKCINRREVRTEAIRRARLAYLQILEPAAFSHEFLAYDEIDVIPKHGIVDSVIVKIDGWEVVGELNVGSRVDAHLMRSEAAQRAANQHAELGGKPVRR